MVIKTQGKDEAKVNNLMDEIKASKKRKKSLDIFVKDKKELPMDKNAYVFRNGQKKDRWMLYFYDKYAETRHRFTLKDTYGNHIPPIPEAQEQAFVAGLVKFSQLKEKVEFSLNQVGLSNSIMYQFPSQLSGGMQKRVAIARAIIDEPEILIFDEPTSGLDPVTGNKINSLIIDNVKRLGSTSITITHDLSSLNKIANKVAMINEGKIIWHGEKEDLQKSKNKTLNEFINIDSDVRSKT